MSYPAPAPVAPAGPSGPGRRRPWAVQSAAGLLALMGLVGLGYALTTLAITGGVVDRFRDAAAGAARTDVDGYTTVVWLFAALGAVLAVILFALYVVLALGLRRGSNVSRISTWVVCGLGVAFGCASTVAVTAQRSGDATPGTLGAALSDAYPSSWITLNLSLAVAQMVAYLIVAVLLVVSPRAFFRGGRPEQVGAAGTFVQLPTYGSANSPGAYPPGPYGPGSANSPGAYPPGPYSGPGSPGASAPGASAPGSSAPGAFAPGSPARGPFTPGWQSGLSGPIAPGSVASAEPGSTGGAGQGSTGSHGQGSPGDYSPDSHGGYSADSQHGSRPASPGVSGFGAPGGAAPSPYAPPAPGAPAQAPAAPPASGATGANQPAPDPSSGGPSGAPPTRGPDDDYWARPSS